MYTYFNLQNFTKTAAKYTLPKYKYKPRREFIYTEDKPVIKDTDILRVFHGFRDLDHAVSACRYGLSGKSRVGRVYSYEADNNPLGLFVTTDPSIAKEFGRYIIEFHAKVNELESPVWPAGSYTVQGQYAQYFGGDEKKREEARENARKRALESNIPSITQSDRPELAAQLLQGELQALFVGNLLPNRIIRVFDRDQDKIYSPYEFLKKYRSHKFTDKEAINSENRIFRIDEEFDPYLYIERINKRYGRRRDLSKKDIVRAIGSDSIDNMRYELNRYLWPKQMTAALAWFSAEYAKYKADKDSYG